MLRGAGIEHRRPWRLAPCSTHTPRRRCSGPAPDPSSCLALAHHPRPRRKAAKALVEAVERNTAWVGRQRDQVRCARCAARLLPLKQGTHVLQLYIQCTAWQLAGRLPRSSALRSSAPPAGRPRLTPSSPLPCHSPRWTSPPRTWPRWPCSCPRKARPSRWEGRHLGTPSGQRGTRRHQAAAERPSELATPGGRRPSPAPPHPPDCCCACPPASPSRAGAHPAVCAQPAGARATAAAAAPGGGGAAWHRSGRRQRRR